jgi:hypothetical protein
MTNTYRPLSVAAKSQYGDAVVDLDLSVMDEKDAIDGGHLELVPRPYKVLSDNFSGGPQDGEYMGALRVETEAALIAGSHIQRDDAGTGGSTTFKDLSAAGGEPAPEPPPVDAPQDKKAK